MKAYVSTGVALVLLVSGHPDAARQTPQQPAAAATAVVSGVLVAADNGEPVRKAEVRLASASPRLTRTTTSDGQGRWAVDALPAGEYALSATRPGYVETVYGARSPGRAGRGTPIRVAAGQRIDDLSLSMPRAGVISGIVSDEYGDPAYNVPVRALRYAYENGERIVRAAGNATTDDLGAYRIPNLEPGEYLVSAVPRDTVAAAAARAESIRRMQADREASARAGDQEARAAVATMAEARREGRMPPPVSRVGYVPMYYPGAVLPAAAAPVRVGLGAQVFGIDIRLDLVETATITGTVLSAAGEPIQGNLKLIDPVMPVSPIGAWFTSSTPDGRFSFSGVVPGTYVLGGNNSPPGTIGGPPAAGGVFQMASPVGVAVTAGDVDGVEVRMQAARTVSGRVDMSSVTAPFNREAFRVNFLPVTTAADWEMRAYRVVPDPDGSFVLPDIVAARYRIDVAGAPDGWGLASAVFNNRDAADYHLTVEPEGRYEGGVLTLTDRLSEVSGTVMNDRSEPVDRFVVVLFPERRDLWLPQSRRIGVAHTGSDGRFVFRRLPAGEYRLALVPAIEPGQEFDAAFLATLAEASVSISLGAGQTQVQDLRVR
jgi:hypothetical protein